MEQALWIYNTLTRRKEVFKPLHAPNVGMYVCGPTVYGDPHLGHARPAITFDILFRYLKHLGYKVRYVRNITDVGHLEHDADEGDDKIEKKARLEQLEPMEIAQYYTNRYHAAMEALNVLPPSIEPHATGHIIEQEELVKQILDNGFAYEPAVPNTSVKATPRSTRLCSPAPVRRPRSTVCLRPRFLTSPISSWVLKSAAPATRFSTKSGREAVMLRRSASRANTPKSTTTSKRSSTVLTLRFLPTASRLT